MRDTFESLDEVTERNPLVRHALYDLAAQLLASQAFSIAVAWGLKLDEDEARRLVEGVAGYPGVTQRRMPDYAGCSVGDRAVEILMTLAADSDFLLRTIPQQRYTADLH